MKTHDVLLVWLLASGLAGSDVPQVNSERVSSARLVELAWVQQMQVVVEDRWLTKADIARLGRLAEASEQDDVFRLAQVVCASVERRQHGNQVSALLRLAPAVLVGGEPSLHQAFRAAGKLRPPVDAEAAESVSRLLPEPEGWRLDDAEAVVEAVRDLDACARPDDALQLGERLAASLPGSAAARWRCLEACGDVLSHRDHPEVAVTAYQAAIASFWSGVSETSTGSGRRRDLSMVEQAWIARLTSRLHRAEAAHDRTRYGEAFCLYREAERQRLEQSRPMDACLTYARLCEQFPATIFAAAARFQRADCLISLADADGQRMAAAQLADEDRRLQDLRSDLVALRVSSQAGSALRGELEAKITDQEVRVVLLRGVPTGAKAEEQAMASLQEILADVDHPYSGEAMVRCGGLLLERQGRVDEARRLLVRAQAWIADARAGRAGRGVDVTVPTEAIEVSAPPPSPRLLDAFGVDRLVTPKPGAVLTARTCSWYLDALEERLVLRLGLAWLVAGKPTEAEACWRRLYDLNPAYAQDEAKGFGSVVQRVLYDLRYQHGGLYAKDREIAAFIDPIRRTRLLAADLLFEAEDTAGAAAGYRRLLAGATGNMGRSETAYCTYALAVCQALGGDKTEARALLARFDDELARTPSHPRALYFRLKTILGASAVSAEDEVVCRADLKRLLRDYPDTPEADAALHGMAWVLSGNPARRDEARAYFEDYLRRYPKGLWGEAARVELAQLQTADTNSHQGH